jgi:hypothetical protein
LETAQQGGRGITPLETTEMFITTRHSGYDRDGGQVASGRFLLLVQPEKYEDSGMPIRALVRFASLHQLGHFMMGSCRAFGHTIQLSGAYGGDGLPRGVPREVYDKAIDVPAELIAAWNTGGGWNGAGSEAPAMREWALKTFPDGSRAFEKGFGFG